MVDRSNQNDGYVKELELKTSELEQKSLEISLQALKLEEWVRVMQDRLLKTNTMNNILYDFISGLGLTRELEAYARQRSSSETLN
ncbi:MAG: hypothetical protein ACM3MK_04175 [Chitinophagales bacterium]